MKLFCAISLILLMNFASNAQKSIHGKVIDSLTNEPLAFANINIKPSNFSTNTDLDGNFTFNSKGNESLIASYVGYEKSNIGISENLNPSDTLLIKLKQSGNMLSEIIIRKGENPANRIVRRAIANKPRNNPENITSFKYNSYNKIIYEYNTSIAADSIAIRQKLKDGHLFIMESVTERKYLNPDFSEERILGTKVSGFKNPAFAAIATDFQPFSFYQDNVKLFDINYLNPLSNGSLKKYDFTLEDSFVQENDTVFILSFKPLPNRNFDGLKGLLYINSNGYALQNVIASPAIKPKIDIKIQQQYGITNGKYWFPQQLNFILTINPIKNISITLNGRSYIRDVKTEIPLTKKDFDENALRIEPDATTKDTLFWETNRVDPLTTSEITTYRVTDSLGQANNFDRKIELIEKLIQSRFPFKYFDIDLSKTLVYNKYESYRIGTGILTNGKFSKNFVLGGFFGYGTRDKRSKYGAQVTSILSKKHDFTIAAGYRDTYIETGNYGLRSSQDDVVDLRNFIGFQYDRIRQSSVCSTARFLKYFTTEVQLNQSLTTPLYNYEFFTNERSFTEFTNTNIAVSLRFAYKERFVSAFNQKVSAGTTFPVFNLAYARGLYNIFNGDFRYSKIELKMEQTFYTTNFGATHYSLEGGFVDSAIPYSLLFTGEGSNDKDMNLVVKNTFQTMSPYEFLSDQYARLYLSHNFGGMLFKIRSFQPSVIIHNNIGWGNLSSPNRHQLIDYKIQNKVFTEAGLQLDNLIRANYFNVASVGLGAALFCKYGAYAEPDFGDNLALRLTFTMSIK